MKSRFTICVYDKRSCHGFPYYVSARTADAAGQQFYDDAEAGGRAPADLITVAVFDVISQVPWTGYSTGNDPIPQPTLREAS